MDEMTISNAQYAENNECIIAAINGALIYVPLDPANRHYAEILRQIDAGELTIAEAD